MSKLILNNPYHPRTVAAQLYEEGFLDGKSSALAGLNGSEVGGNAFSGDGGKEALIIPVAEGVWLMTRFTPENSPSWSVSTLKMSAVDLQDYIQEEFEGWKCVRCQFDGVDMSKNGYVLAVGEEA